VSCGNHPEAALKAISGSKRELGGAPVLIAAQRVPDTGDGAGAQPGGRVQVDGAESPARAGEQTGQDLVDRSGPGQRGRVR
jgi:hypothetical protein